MIRSPLLDCVPWLEHGFGTRHSAGLSSEPALVTLNQIHSDICVYAGGGTGTIGEGDALYTDQPGALLAVRTADCFPILIADERLKAVAIVHAGWRGTAARIAAKAVEAMQSRFASRAGDLLAAIGPGIGPCCYEVGPEVASLFQDLFPERHDLASRTRIDLAEANRRALRVAGVPEGRIDGPGPCTACAPAEFHSWRRDGPRAGRMLSAIRILG